MKKIRQYCMGVVAALMFMSGQSLAATSEQEIGKVIEDFRLAIINKDEQKFVDLFYDKSIPWLGIRADKRRGSLPSQNGVDHGSYVKFIAWIVSHQEVIEEKFINVQIETDGDIASVYFDYSFHIGDYKQNWGDEAWQLVKTGSGWKINSVIYSVIMNPVVRAAKS